MKTKKLVNLLQGVLFIIASVTGVSSVTAVTAIPRQPPGSGVPPPSVFKTLTQTDWSGGSSPDVWPVDTAWINFNSSQGIDYSSVSGQISVESNVNAGTLASSIYDTTNYNLNGYSYNASLNIGSVIPSATNLYDTPSYVEYKSQCGPWRPINYWSNAYGYASTNQFQYRIHLIKSTTVPDPVLDNLQIQYSKYRLPVAGCSVQAGQPIPPYITMSGNPTINILQGATYTDPGAWSKDPSGDITCGMTTDNPVDTSVPGTYTVTYTSTSTLCNNTTTATRTVHVLPTGTTPDTTAPIITLNGNANVTVAIGTTYTDAGATAMDNQDGDITANILTINRVNTNALGTYLVTYDVTDSWGNVATEVSRTVRVINAWVQKDWSGGPGQTDWNSGDVAAFNTGTNIDYSNVAPQIQLVSISRNVVYTTDTDFNGGTYSQTQLYGTEEPASVGLAATGSGSTYYTNGTYVSSLVDISSKGFPIDFQGVENDGGQKVNPITYEVRSWSSPTSPDYDWDSISCFTDKSPTLSPCVNPASPYLQFRANFSGGVGQYPMLDEVDFVYPMGYTTSGSLISSTYDSGDPTTVWGPLSYTGTTPTNTSIVYEYSNDGGSTWYPAQEGDTLGQSQTLRYRVTLYSTDGIATPTFQNSIIPYGPQYTVTARVDGGNGTVSPSTQFVPPEDSATITITPNTGYQINTVTDNGSAVPLSSLQFMPGECAPPPPSPFFLSSIPSACNNAYNYTITNVMGNHTIVVTFVATITNSNTNSQNGNVNGGNTNTNSTNGNTNGGNNNGQNGNVNRSRSSGGGGGGSLSNMFPDSNGVLHPTNPPQSPEDNLHNAAPITGTGATGEFTPPYFTDTENNWAKQYIDILHEKCGITGYTDKDGTPLHLFGPDNLMTRAELVKILIQCQLLNGDTTGEKPFPDVELNTWFAPYLAKAKLLGWIEGYKDHTFKPLQAVNQAEALKIILLSEFSKDTLQVNSLFDLFQGTWFQKYMLYSIAKKYVADNTTPDRLMTRADIAKLIVLIKGW